MSNHTLLTHSSNQHDPKVNLRTKSNHYIDNKTIICISPVVLGLGLKFNHTLNTDITDPDLEGNNDVILS